MDPEILIVNEVLSVGDLVFQRKRLDKMTAIMTSGATVIFVSHDQRAVSTLCPRAILLEKDRVQHAGATASRTSRSSDDRQRQ